MYHVAIPSYRRPEALLTHTITMLLDGGVPMEHVTVFVHDNDPYLQAYRDGAAALGYRLVETPARGLIEQREAIFSAYPDGTRLVTVDDDVKELQGLTGKPRPDGRFPSSALRRINDVDGFIRYAFETTENEGLTAFGLYPVGNAYFMRPGYTTDLKFLIFTFVGVITYSGHPAQRFTVPTKEDYEHSLRRWFYDGGVVRFSHAYANANVYRGAGGLVDSGARTPVTEADAVRRMVADWGEKLVKVNSRRSSDFTEILLGRAKRHNGNQWSVQAGSRK